MFTVRGAILARCWRSVVALAHVLDALLFVIRQVKRGVTLSAERVFVLCAVFLFDRRTILAFAYVLLARNAVQMPRRIT